MQIKLEGLTKVFSDLKSKKETRAVSNLDIVIPSGKLVGLLGPSGCGKSTTLYMISGLLYPTEGRIFFGDEDVTELSPEKRGIGLVFQNYALYPHMTVRKNILFPLENMNIKKTSIDAAYKKAHLLESPVEAKAYYTYLDQSESLKNKYRRHENEAKAVALSSKLAAQAAFDQKKKDATKEERVVLKNTLKLQLDEIKADLAAKIQSFDENYLKEKAAITPNDLPTLLQSINQKYQQVEKDFCLKKQELIQSLKTKTTDKDELAVLIDVEVAKIQPESVKIVEVAKNTNYRKQMEDDVVAMAKLVGIDDQLDKTPAQLSGGQQQRVAIARALVKKPRVLLLDEPLSNLDARLRLQTREEIKRIQRETGITTVFVTHDQEEAMSISDEIILMNYGEEKQKGVPQDVYDQPSNLFSAKFLGTPPINLYNGVVEGNNVLIGGKVVYTTNKFEKGLSGPVVVGVRPEGYELNKDGALTVESLYIETIGRDLSLVSAHKEAISESMRIILNNDDVRLSGRGPVSFNLKANKTYVFDKESGRRLA